MSQPQINLLRMYMKDASFEHPAAPFAFFEETASQVQDKLDIQVAINKMSDDAYEVGVRATLTLSREGKAMMLLEVEQAGVFQLTNVPAEDIDGILGINCAAMVYSYLRSNFADMMTRATLPPLHIPEPNWQEQFQARAAQAGVPPVAGAGAATANE